MLLLQGIVGAHTSIILNDLISRYSRYLRDVAQGNMLVERYGLIETGMVLEQVIQFVAELW